MSILALRVNKHDSLCRITALALEKWAIKLKTTIREEVQVFAKSIIVEFSGDRKKQHVEVKCSFSPYQKKMRK